MNTEPVEILLSAVWDAFLRTFPHRNSLTIFNEGHGREAWSDEIDMSSTVGWFTTSEPDHNMFRIELDFAPGVVSECDGELLAAKLTEAIVVFCNVMDMPLLSPDQIRYLRTTTLLPSEKPLSAIPTNEQLMVASIIPTEMEWALESAWSDTFNCRLSPEMKAGETIFDLGGDLVSASLISAHMERQGYVLSVEDVLGNPTWFSQLTLLTNRSLRDVDV